MNTSIAEQIKVPGIVDVKFSDEAMTVSLTDGRILSIPLAWYPRLSEANRKQLENYEISPSGYGIHWPDLDEDLSVLGFLLPDRK
jgi:hypothetical protein